MRGGQVKFNGNYAEHMLYKYVATFDQFNNLKTINYTIIMQIS